MSPIILSVRSAPSIQPTPRTRAGAVPYLNARPLTARLAGDPRIAGGLLQAEPIVLAREMAAGRLDFALLPAFAALSGQGPLKAADAVAIGSDGPVGSVLLYARRPLGSLRTLAEDPASMSSNALVRILLAESHGVRPARARPDEADGVLVIGDAALKPLPGSWETVMDLGQAWRDLTGLPFVYALWAGPGLEEASAGVLREAAGRGLEDRETIARAGAAELGIPPATALDYLMHRIRYELGERQREGLRAFARMIRAHGLSQETHEPAWI